MALLLSKDYSKIQDLLIDLYDLNQKYSGKELNMTVMMRIGKFRKNVLQGLIQIGYLKEKQSKDDHRTKKIQINWNKLLSRWRSELNILSFEKTERYKERVNKIEYKNKLHKLNEFFENDDNFKLTFELIKEHHRGLFDFDILSRLYGESLPHPFKLISLSLFIFLYGGIYPKIRDFDYFHPRDYKGKFNQLKGTREERILTIWHNFPGILRFLWDSQIIDDIEENWGAIFGKLISEHKLDLEALSEELENIFDMVNSSITRGLYVRKDVTYDDPNYKDTIYVFFDGFLWQLSEIKMIPRLFLD